MTSEPGYRELLSEHVDAPALEKLARYAELLEKWSKRHSLVRFSGRRELVERHILDALEGRRLLRGAGWLLDVGSGAGLPGVPLLVARPRWCGVLLEPRHKRWAFLKLVIRELEINAEAVDRRTDELAGDQLFELITARAVGGHGALLSWARNHLAPSGGVALWTTENGAREASQTLGWRVISSPLVGLERGRLVHCEPERQVAAGPFETEGSCST